MHTVEECIEMCERVASTIQGRGYRCEIGLKYEDHPHRNFMAHIEDRDNTIISDIHINHKEIEIWVATNRPNSRTMLESNKFDMSLELTSDYFADIILQDWLGVEPPKTLIVIMMEMMAKEISDEMEKEIINDMFRKKDDGTRS